MKALFSLVLFLLSGLIFCADYNFELYNMNDKMFSLKKILAEAETRLVVVDFVSMYCEPCKKAVPDWSALYKEYKAKGLEIVVIILPSAGDRAGEAKLIKAFFEQHNVKFMYSYDKYSVVGKKFGVVDKNGSAIVPQIFLIDKKMELAFRSDDHNKVIAKIKEVLSK